MNDIEGHLSDQISRLGSQVDQWDDRRTPVERIVRRAEDRRRARRLVATGAAMTLVALAIVGVVALQRDDRTIDIGGQPDTGSDPTDAPMDTGFAPTPQPVATDVPIDAPNQPAANVLRDYAPSPFRWEVRDASVPYLPFATLGGNGALYATGTLPAPSGLPGDFVLAPFRSADGIDWAPADGEPEWVHTPGLTASSGGTLYALATSVATGPITADRPNGDLVVRSSTDGGLTWTEQLAAGFDLRSVGVPDADFQGGLTDRVGASGSLGTVLAARVVAFPSNPALPPDLASASVAYNGPEGATLVDPPTPAELAEAASRCPDGSTVVFGDGTRFPNGTAACIDGSGHVGATLGTAQHGRVVDWARLGLSGDALHFARGAVVASTSTSDGGFRTVLLPDSGTAQSVVGAMATATAFVIVVRELGADTASLVAYRSADGARWERGPAVQLGASESSGNLGLVHGRLLLQLVPSEEVLGLDPDSGWVRLPAPSAEAVVGSPQSDRGGLAGVPTVGAGTQTGGLCWLQSTADDLVAQAGGISVQVNGYVLREQRANDWEIVRASDGVVIADPSRSGSLPDNVTFGDLGPIVWADDGTKLAEFDFGALFQKADALGVGTRHLLLFHSDDGVTWSVDDLAQVLGIQDSQLGSITSINTTADGCAVSVALTDRDADGRIIVKRAIAHLDS